MTYQAYVINLAHAKERWAHVQGNLRDRDIPFVRVEGVYGDNLALPIREYHERKYHVHNGKVTNMREIGCFLSHINALNDFLKTDHPYALILEDDAALPPEIKTILSESIQHSDKWDLLRLSSSREGEYLTFGRLSTGHDISYNIRVLKNTAAYFINRYAAQRLTEKMLPMYLPYDEALDRDWDYGFKTAVITPFPVPLDEELPSQIPRAKRLRLYRSTTFHIFHTLTHLERAHHRKKYFREL